MLLQTNPRMEADMCSRVSVCSNNSCLQLRYAALRYATLCSALLRFASLRCAMLRYALLRYAALRFATLCYATLRCGTLRYARLCSAVALRCSRLDSGRPVQCGLRVCDRSSSDTHPIYILYSP